MNAETDGAGTTNTILTEGKTSTTDLLRSYSALAIPHFQRGLVWDSGAVASLLESLFHKTPCGAIILWPSDNARMHGVPLQGDHAIALIVDGQQRIRSLHSVFGTDEAQIDVEDVSEDSQDRRPAERVWCLNLGRLAE